MTQTPQRVLPRRQAGPSCWVRCALACAGLGSWGLVAQATEFQLTPIRFPNGVTVSGTLTTDGSVGALTPANVVGWRVVLTQVSVREFTPSQPGGATVMGVKVSADGKRLTVRTSPDGVNDGGLLAFGSFGPGPELGVQVANFTSTYANGGVAFYLAGAAFEWQWLQAPNHSAWPVADAPLGNGQFRLRDITFPSGVVMSGSLTTNGRTGALGVADFLDWRIRTTERTQTVYWRDATGSNSQLWPSTNGLSSDGHTLSVMRPGGVLGVGIVPRPPASSQGVLLADFSATAPAQGQATWFNAYATQSRPLGFTGAQYPVATALPSF